MPLHAPVHTSPPYQVTERVGVAEAAGVNVGDIIVELQGEEVPVDIALQDFAERVSYSPSLIRRAPFVGVGRNQTLGRAGCDGARVRAQYDRDGGMRCGTVPQVTAGGLALGGRGRDRRWKFETSGAAPPPRAVDPAVPSHRPVPAMTIQWR